MANKSWFKFEGKATDTPTIYIYGVIGAYDIGAKDFIKELNGIKAKEATIRMHSPGGDVFEGMSIYNAIEEHPAKITGQVDGMCGSICSVLAMACDTLTMAKGSMMMIHNASSPINGNAQEMRKRAEVLDQVDGIQLAAYRAKTGMSEKDIKALMDKTEFMNAEIAKSRGFCDAIGNQLAIRAEVDFTCLDTVPDEVKAMFNERDIPTNERDLEAILRDAGISKKDALTAVAQLKAETRRDSEVLEGEKMKAFMQSFVIREILTT